MSIFPNKTQRLSTRWQENLNLNLKINPNFFGRVQLTCLISQNKANKIHCCYQRFAGLNSCRILFVFETLSGWNCEWVQWFLSFPFSVVTVDQRGKLICLISERNSEHSELLQCFFHQNVLLSICMRCCDKQALVGRVCWHVSLFDTEKKSTPNLFIVRLCRTAWWEFWSKCNWAVTRVPSPESAWHSAS